MDQLSRLPSSPRGRKIRISTRNRYGRMGATCDSVSLSTARAKRPSPSIVSVLSLVTVLCVLFAWNDFLFASIIGSGGAKTLPVATRDTLERTIAHAARRVAREAVEKGWAAEPGKIAGCQVVVSRGGQIERRDAVHRHLGDRRTQRLDQIGRAHV